ncbi:MAG TPA: M15 family metallopeptidase [Candidatus Saccharimonadales bacterium]|nr:M15 family metallopeptidase [Candidatus Saccharimonadales bacterium]
MNLDEVIAIKGKDAPVDVIRQLVLIDLPFADFSGKSRTGQIVVHKELANEIKDIFTKIKETGFPLESMVPARRSRPKGPTNNTSSFNYRKIIGTDRFSQHSYGRAIDINPALNPFFSRHGIVPEGASYDETRPGTLTEDSPPVRIFESHGWLWMGRKKEHKDYMHFEKPA